MKPLFEIRHLTAGYRDPIVKDISFTVNGGELVGILGRNGQGKSTLLRSVTGETRRFAGEILCRGVDTARLSAKKRAGWISVLPQKSQIPAGVSVKEILEMGCYANHRIFRGADATEREKIRAAAEQMGLSHLLGEDCAKLSIGQQQLVLLCRMLVQNAPVMLLDEPNAALDYDNSELLFRTLKKLVQTEERSGILVLHDPEVALRWCDRLLVLEKGSLLGDVQVHPNDPETVEQVLRILYPNICVRAHPYEKGYLCYLKE